ncbi:hypothetical protein CDAR_95681 [Caerostris darwini]|uniref:Uncharacterized protein n=1 Tax=Caerostris darwini TaxID=1538125 RepID=A0AAV4UPS4_9ARAC|nr:hypothetical protein CDAR_95681 [Caerostris darwini]
MSGRTPKAFLAIVFAVAVLMPPCTECGLYKMMAEAMMGHMMGGWDGGGGGGKGITFGLKSQGMTAIIPIPLPVPVFTKDKGGGGGGGGQKIKYIPVPVPSGKEDWWR